MQLVPISKLPGSALSTDFCLPASAASTVLSNTYPKGTFFFPGLQALFPALLSRQFTRGTVTFLFLREVPSRTLLAALQKGTRGRPDILSEALIRVVGGESGLQILGIFFRPSHVSAGLTRVSLGAESFSDPPGLGEGRLVRQNMNHWCPVPPKNKTKQKNTALTLKGLSKP